MQATVSQTDSTSGHVICSRVSRDRLTALSMNAIPSTPPRFKQVQGSSSRKYTVEEKLQLLENLDIESPYYLLERYFYNLLTPS